MNNIIECVNECILLGIHISNDFSDNNIFHTVNKFSRKCNELRYDLKFTIDYLFLSRGVWQSALEFRSENG